MGSDTSPPEPEAGSRSSNPSWFPAVVPERLRLLRKIMIVMPLASAALFSGGLLLGLWSISKGFPDFGILKAHAELLHAKIKIRTAVDKLPSYQELVSRRPSEAGKVAHDLEYELSDVSMTHHYRMRERLKRNKELVAHVKAIDQAFASSNLWDTLRSMSEGKGSPAEALATTAQRLGELLSCMANLEQKLVVLYPWLGE